MQIEPSHQAKPGYSKQSRSADGAKPTNATLSISADGRRIDPDKRGVIDHLDLGMPCFGKRFETDGLIVDLNPADPWSANFEANELSFSLQLGRRDYEIGLSSDKMTRRQMAPGAVSVSPKGSTVLARSGPEDAEFLAICIDEARVEQALEACGLSRSAIRIDPNINHPDLLVLGDRLRAFLNVRQGRSKIYGETLSHAILLCVISALEGKAAFPKGEHTKQQIEMLCEYIEANLGNSLSLSDLANVAEINVYTLGKSFKKFTGLTPHQFILERRVARTAEQIVSTENSLAEIAFVTGFSSQSHMTNAFRKHFGVSPGAYRAETRRTSPIAKRLSA